MQSISNSPLQLDLFSAGSSVDLSSTEIMACLAELLLSAFRCRQQQLLKRKGADHVESH